MINVIKWIIDKGDKGNNEDEKNKRVEEIR